MIRRLRNRRPEIREESEAATEQTDTEVTAEDSEESEAATEQTSTEAAEEALPESEAAEEAEADTEAVEPSVERGPSRLGLGWAAGIAAALVLLAGGIGTGGYLALRAHQQSQTHGA